MTKGIPRKQHLAEQRHAKRLRAAPVWAVAAKKPTAAVASKAGKPPAGRAEPLPPMRYPTKRASLGTPQTAGDR